MYLDLLERALRQPDTRSIALTGSYGSGKSSVLHALGRSYWDRRFPWWHRRRVIELSLSTLDPRMSPDVPAENPAERERSNRIQKELVKQLLYRLPPRRTPNSRFPRATTPSLSGLAVVGILALLALGWAATALAGWQRKFDQRLTELRWSPPLFWGGVAIGLLILALAAWRVIAGRYALQTGLKAGVLSVSLEPRSSSYFDQYLDEIVYFFQVSKTDVVLIEDVDRFDDAIVFDTLRALKSLVNNSGQVGRRVVFVYAIRDSVLGLVGAPTDDAWTKAGTMDDASAHPPGATTSAMTQLDRANRAKHFDVIIPIVPFVTADNARDLMMEVMAPHVADAKDKPGISPALIRVASRHVADMRTLLSLRNEYEVHYDRLVTSASQTMPGISPDIVFSLVLLRATSPETYENIRLASSPLDDLTRRWLTLVEHNVAVQTEALTNLATQLENGQSSESRAALAGRKLHKLRSELLGMSIGLTAREVEFIGPVTETDLGALGGWQQIANGTQLVVNLWSGTDPYGRRAGLQQILLGPQVLTRLLGMPIDPQTWHDLDLADLNDKIDDTREEITFLRHHTWKQLCGRTDLTIKSEGTEPVGKNGEVDFKDLVKTYAPTTLVVELIEHGYLPRHFARYASMFYGTDVGLNAAEYIARAIEPGTPILEFELDPTDVNQILREQGADNDDSDHLFDEPAIYNLDIIRYLLDHRPGAAKRVAAHLAERWGEQEQTLVGRIFERETPAMAGQLAELMAPTWVQAIGYTALDAPVTPRARLHLVNAVLGAIGAGERVDLDIDVARYLSEHDADLGAVTDPPDEDRAAIIMATFAAAGATVSDLGNLNTQALAAAAQTSVYPINATNLGALGGATRVALDTLHSESTTLPIYEHAVNHLDAYLEALTRLNPIGTPVTSPGRFADILNDIATKPQAALLDKLVAATSSSCRVPDLGQVLVEVWPALVAQRRTDPTFGNVQRYIAEYDVDDDLGTFLTEHGAIATPAGTPQPDRLTMAAQILAARDAIADPGVRVALAASVTPGLLPIGHVAHEDADLIGPLLRIGLLADEPATFDPGRVGRWEDFEDAVAASENFGMFADSTTMPAQRLAPVLSSRRIPETTKAALVARLPLLVSSATSSQATAIADVLARRCDVLDLPRLQALLRAGASNSALARVIAAQVQTLSIDDLRQILMLMGGDYARVSSGHRGGTVRFPIDAAHRALLSRLEGVTHSGAKVVTTKSHGTNLEATLHQPRA
ncbi:hypothetical protein [Cellulomonas sp. NTE-D12]|uniref:YobI family P-loop NTPase n=1 Tax=Cellulomonas sp. NTE-D12 TaxID=2962632 RepID=UPI003081B3B7